MRVSPVMRGAYAAAAFVFSLSLAPSFARMGAPIGRPGSGGGHFAHFAPHGFNGRFGSDPSRFNGSGPNRFDRLGFNHFQRFGPNHGGYSRFGPNQLFVGGWGWGGWDGVIPVPFAAAEPIILDGGAPVVINIGVDPGPGDAGGGYSGGCVIHKLNYDNNGKYVGERQIPQC